MPPLLFDLNSGQFCSSDRKASAISYFENDGESKYPLAYPRCFVARIGYYCLYLGVSLYKSVI